MGAVLWLSPTTTSDMGVNDLETPSGRRTVGRAEPAIGLARGGDGLHALHVEREDLQLDREVDLADVDVWGHVHDCGSKVEDRLDARIDKPLGNLLGRSRRCRDDA